MEFWLQMEDDEKIQLPVKPSEYTVSVAHRNTVVNVLQVGDVNLMGKTGLREISLKSFFPAKDYNFSNNSDRKEPLAYVEMIEKWRKSTRPVRVIITGVLNMEATIESFSYGEKDATRDIYYTMALKEYKKLKGSSKTGSTRSTKEPTSSSGKSYTVKDGDNLWKIAKQMYGDGSKNMQIYEANKDTIKNPDVIHAGMVLVIP